jgi:hypothetical protein
MSEIEGFKSIISTLILAKSLHDIGRFEIAESGFSDQLCWDDYYHNIFAVISRIFSGYESNYSEDNCMEIMCFTDEIISNYFVHAWEYGKLHNLHYSENPYVTEAQNEVRSWLGVSHCSYWKLAAYIRTKKSAQKSKLLVFMDTGCGCNSDEYIAYGLIQLYTWFVAKNAEFDAMKTTMDVAEPILLKIQKQNIRG